LGALPIKEDVPLQSSEGGLWGRSSVRFVGGGLIAVALVCSLPVAAADIAPVLALKAPAGPVAPAWSGLYFGGHFGYARGGADTFAETPASTSFGSMFSGMQGGYNVVLPSSILLGLEGDLSFANFYLDDQITTRFVSSGEITETIDFIARLRGRAGVIFGHWMVYAAAGLSWSQARLIEPISHPALTTNPDGICIPCASP
jgi:high affinity Mn2+ porin